MHRGAQMLPDLPELGEQVVDPLPPGQPVPVPREQVELPED